MLQKNQIYFYIKNDSNDKLEDQQPCDVRSLRYFHLFFYKSMISC